MERGTDTPAPRSALQELARSLAARALALSGVFVLLKVGLVRWYAARGVDALAGVAPHRVPALAGADLLAAAAVFVVALAAVLPLAAWGRRGGQRLAGALGAAPFAAAALVGCVSFKVNQAYGRPLSFGLLALASSGVGALRDSVLASVDALLLAVTAAALLAVLLAPRVLGPALRRLGAVGAGALVLGLGAAGGGAAQLLFRNVYAFGLKTNPLVELARSLPRRPASAHDVLRELEASERRLEGHGGAALDLSSHLAPGHEPGHPELRGKAAGYNLLLVVLESTAARYVDAQTAPTLAGLGAEGLRYEHHFTTAPFTLTAQYSLYYSAYLPFADFDGRTLYGRPPPSASLLESFKAAGYDTALFCSAFFYFADLGWLFEHKGVDTLAGGEQLQRPEHPVHSWGVQESQTVEALSAWLAEHRGGPFFAIYNPITPHHPYHAPLAARRFAGYGVEDNYRNALSYTDQQVAQLLEVLRRLELERRTVVVVVSDHGETVLGPGGAAGHGLDFSDAEFRTPFLVWAPELLRQPQREALFTNHLDVAPTLASLFGLPQPAGWQGRDLLAPQVERRTLYLGLGASNRSGLIDNGYALEHNANDGSLHGYTVTADLFTPLDSLPEALAAQGPAVQDFEARLKLRHLRAALQADGPPQSPSRGEPRAADQL
ncbi:sulfatase-like hydrolase/transferase [Aggregicoccus sp. 17bor-14]|uniref:sulfatase-like hydrolase/transferase n=1 Tax=Myxococcaceae TaxID=31 RepID=UPI00129C5D3F|nr:MULTISPECIES: sulfatase-like hydrolase/transferase [Myxococcaceae]MBF5042617.1 sulfatase-like hydrolase/transferase [Simulacricoccus sp. 17bor-14]MRI88385.1 sulfatase-like hydrolase/transferase [Aggregicoccus sp. 17bor-14]